MTDTYLDDVRDQLDFIGERYCEHHKTNVRFYVVPVGVKLSKNHPPARRRELTVEYDAPPSEPVWRSGSIPDDWSRDDVERLVSIRTPASTYPAWEYGARVKGSFDLHWPFGS